jgi:protein-S-isoprenylcysteine O-methyltransferase Ste14
MAKGTHWPRLHGLLDGIIVVYFVIALEVLVMISPFAAFFYAAFNPLLLLLAHSPATRWLAGFFLPHMVVPPSMLLKAVRVGGSVLFVGGTVVFLACAADVYSRKLLRRGPALGGPYRWIRHPQYLALAATGLGLAILWPRFLVIVLWTVMVGLYWLLARDEERRMLKQFGDRYRDYMARTGMFVPRSVERLAGRLPLPRSKTLRRSAAFAFLAIVAVGGAFALRAYTVDCLPVWSSGRVTAISILTTDEPMLDHRMQAILALPQVSSRLARVESPIVVYLVPTEYVMQGLIADTGPRWRLFRHHQTFAMITDWIFHPFRHLEGRHMIGHRGMGMPETAGVPSGATVRRLIFLAVGNATTPAGRSSVFALSAARTPLFFTDIDIHDLVLLDVRDLTPGTGWGRVPTPMF